MMDLKKYAISMIFIGLMVSRGAFAAEQAFGTVADPADIYQEQSDELLEATPVDEDTLLMDPIPVDREISPFTPETMPPGEPYPIGEPAPIEMSISKVAQKSEMFRSNTMIAQHVRQFLPYSFSAYIPELDATEVNLGLLLHEPPGIEAGLNWGAMQQVMVNAKLTVQGASYTSGIKFRYAFRSELAAETRPAIALEAGWRFMNHRTNTDERLNVFRGNRFGTAVIFSKWLGSMAKALDAKSAIEDFFNYFSVHVAALMEYQSGRKNSAEDEYSGIEFGARTALGCK